MVYSQGFNPRPRVGFSPALAVGVTSEAEYLDFESHERLEVEAVLERINQALPNGMRFDALQPIRRDVPALTESIYAARYRIQSANGHDLQGAVDRFKRRGSVTAPSPRERLSQLLGASQTVNCDVRPDLIPLRCMNPLNASLPTVCQHYQHDRFCPPSGPAQPFGSTPALPLPMVQAEPEVTTGGAQFWVNETAL